MAICIMNVMLAKKTAGSSLVNWKNMQNDRGQLLEMSLAIIWMKTGRVAVTEKGQMFFKREIMRCLAIEIMESQKKITWTRMLVPRPIMTDSQKKTTWTQRLVHRPIMTTYSL